MKSKFVLLISFFGLVATMCSLCFSTIMPLYSITELTKKSDLIIIGKVENKTCSYRQNNIFTYVRIKVKEILFGRTENSTIVVEVFGGEIGTKCAIADGSASFYNDEEVLIFLRKTTDSPSATYMVVGLSQGKFKLIRNSLNQRVNVEREFKNIMFIKKKNVSFPEDLDGLMTQIKHNIN